MTSAASTSYRLYIPRVIARRCKRYSKEVACDEVDENGMIQTRDGMQRIFEGDWIIEISKGVYEVMDNEGFDEYWQQF